MHIVVNGLATRYESKGSGKVIVLLHGWGDTAATFKRLETDLGTKYQLVALDLPGFGGTDAPPQAWGLDNYAQFVADFLHKLDLKPYVLLGHSNGAAIIIRGVGTGILTADKLVLLAAAGIRDTYKARKKAIRLFAKSGKLAARVLPRRYQRQLRKRVYRTLGSDLLVAEHLQETFKLIITDDVQADAAKVTIPTLLVYGEDDEATPVTYGETYERLIHSAHLIRVPGAGHFVHHDAPQAVCEAVEAFL
jgi:pimeloyl-ACP methyl ester carboxylesterase